MILILSDQEVKDLQNVVYSAMKQADEAETTNPFADRLELIYEKLRRFEESLTKEEMIKIMKELAK